MVENKQSFDLNTLQKEVMLFVDKWVRKEKTPVPRTEIVSMMNSKGIKSYTTLNVINTLMRKGYIRKAARMGNKSYYIQLRRI